MKKVTKARKEMMKREPNHRSRKDWVDLEDLNKIFDEEMEASASSEDYVDVLTRITSRWIEVHTKNGIDTPLFRRYRVMAKTYLFSRMYSKSGAAIAKVWTDA